MLYSVTFSKICNIATNPCFAASQSHGFCCRACNTLQQMGEFCNKFRVAKYLIGSCAGHACGQPVRLAPAASQVVFAAVKVVYIAHGGGARRIRRLLAERGVAPVVSERTIRRYLRAIRGELSDAV